MHLRAKLFLRMRQFFYKYPDGNFINIANKESILKRYISLYPSHLDFIEILYAKKTTDLIYFFKIPSKKKFVIN
jgi:hypothetical protein